MAAGDQVVTLGHREDGPSGAPAVVLAPSLGTTLELWDDLTERLSRRYRVVRFDHRGHGGSPTPPGPWTVSHLAADVVALADRLGLDRFAFLGLSLGGAVGQTLALEHPGRLGPLVLACTGPSFGDPETWHDRAARVRAEGMEFLAEPTRDRWFTPATIAARPDEVARVIAMLTATDPDGYAACCEALASYDVSRMVGAITAPTRVVAGSEDAVSPPAVAEALASAIPDADLVVIEGAAHIANVARPEEFDAAVLEHLDRWW